MSGAPPSHDDTTAAARPPPHGHPAGTTPTVTTTTTTTTTTRASDKGAATAEHPPASKPDPTTAGPSADHPPRQLSHPPGASSQHAAQGGLAAAAAPGASELARLKISLKNGLRQYPDFPTPGVLFEDIMPIFASPQLHNSLIRALELQVADVFHTQTGVKSDVDVVVGLESRGFLFGPTLALRLGAAFVPVRKKGKLPGRCVTVAFKKEYGEDFFQMQDDAIPSGAKVVVVDDIIATGGSAAAAGSLVKKLGGHLLGYIFLMELDFLKGRSKLDAPVYTLLSGQEEALQKQ